MPFTYLWAATNFGEIIVGKSRGYSNLGHLALPLQFLPLPVKNNFVVMKNCFLVPGSRSQDFQERATLSFVHFSWSVSTCFRIRDQTSPVEQRVVLVFGRLQLRHRQLRRRRRLRRLQVHRKVQQGHDGPVPRVPAPVTIELHQVLRPSCYRYTRIVISFTCSCTYSLIKQIFCS